jgi:hypothetical protein
MVLVIPVFGSTLKNFDGSRNGELRIGFSISSPIDIAVLTLFHRPAGALVTFFDHDRG